MATNVRPSKPVASALTAVGALCLLAGMLTYRSPDSPQILGRWSLQYVVALIIVVGATTAVIAGIRAFERADRPSPALLPFGIGAFALGLAYLWSATLDPANGSRLVDLNIFGSLDPGPVVLEFVAMAAFGAATLAAVWSRLGPRGKNVALAASTVGLLTLLGEGGARSMALVDPMVQGFPTYRHTRWFQREVRAFNHLGFRDREAAARSDGDRTLAVLGDSYAFGWGVDDLQHRFGERTVDLLSEADSARWSVVTAALPNSHTLQHRDFWDRISGLRPDLVVLLYVFNDIDYLASVTERDEVAGGVEGSTLSPRRLLFINSYLVQEVYIRLRKIRAGRMPTGGSPYEDPDLLGQHLADLRELVEVVRASGAAVSIVPFTFGVGSQAGYAAFEDALEVEGLPLCSIRQAFVDVTTTDFTVNSLDAHPNERGHDLAARSAAECLRETLQEWEAERADSSAGG